MTAATVDQPASLGDRARRLFGSGWLWLAVVLLVPVWPVTMALRTKLPPVLPQLALVGPWHGIKSDGRELPSRELVGRIYVVSFLRPGCGEACRPRIEWLLKLQKRGRNLAPRLHLLTVAAGGAPASTLAAEVKDLPWSPRIWSFVGEGDLTELRSGALSALAAVGVADASGLDAGRWVILVDGVGRVRAVYDAEDARAHDRLLLDAGLLVNRG